MSVSAARALWEQYEPVHDVVYFAPESRASAERAGLRGFWRGYFAMRAAPLGPVGPGPVTAAFHGFAATMTARALPSVWSLCTPQAALDARLAGACAALRRAGVPDAVGRAADLAWAAASEIDVPGRVLAAANADLPRPEDPLAALWQAATTLREHRGDGHVAVLVAEGIGPVLAHHLKAAAGDTDGEWLRTARGFDEQAWVAGADQARRRGWADASGALTATGAVVRGEIERRTDDAAARPWAALGERRTAELAALLAPIAATVLAAGDVPAGNPVGLVRR
ncbi:SCO6745 family protein [Pseudonocardia spirodelae]|uniref:SalK n=1 Tax=Pseudonocardia spirodelae TaxID=3133431 RepID=A0ABU8T729_9PSEU